MISAKQAAERLGISGARVRQLLDAGKLRGQHIAGVWIVDEASVTERIQLMADAEGRPERRTKERRERRHAERRGKE